MIHRLLAPKGRHWLPAVLVACLLAISCGSDPADPDIGPLAGRWEATDLTVTNQENPQQSVDLIAAGGALTLTVEPSGYYTLSFDFQGAAPGPELGVLRAEGDRLIIDVQVSPTGPRVDTATYSLSGNRLAIEGPTIFDFDFDAQAEDAWLEVVFERDEAAMS